MKGTCCTRHACRVKDQSYVAVTFAGRRLASKGRRQHPAVAAAPAHGADPIVSTQWLAENLEVSNSVLKVQHGEATVGPNEWKKRGPMGCAQAAMQSQSSVQAAMQAACLQEATTGIKPFSSMACANTLTLPIMHPDL